MTLFERSVLKCLLVIIDLLLLRFIVDSGGTRTNRVNRRKEALERELAGDIGHD